MCRTYYVSANRGNDNHSGSSPKEAFASLAAVNRLELGPGDRVLLECGSVFENQYLHLSARGTEEKPVVISSYGEGTLPCICGNGGGIWFQDYGVELDVPTHVWKGEVSSTVLLTDVSNLILSNLEITNCGNTKEDESYNSARKMDRTESAIASTISSFISLVSLFVSLSIIFISSDLSIILLSGSCKSSSCFA